MRFVLFTALLVALATFAGFGHVMAGAGPPGGKIYEKRCGGQLGRPDRFYEYVIGFTALYEEEVSNGWQTCIEPFSADTDYREFCIEGRHRSRMRRGARELAGKHFGEFHIMVSESGWCFYVTWDE